MAVALASAAAVAAVPSMSGAAGSFPPGVGVATKSGAVIDAAVAPAGDVDDYVVAGLTGQRLRAGVRLGKKNDLAPVVQLLDPSGALSAASGGRKARVDHVLERPGVWTLRVLGADSGTSGTYRLSVALSRPPVVVDAPVVPEGDGTYRTRFAAGPGDRIETNLRWDGDRPDSIELRDPDDVVAFAQVRPARRGLRVIATLPATAAVGAYSVAVRSEVGTPLRRVRFKTKVTTDRLKGRARRSRLAAAEPRILGAPVGAGLGASITFAAQNAADPPDDSGALPDVFLGDQALVDVEVDGTTIVARVPADTPAGEALLHLRTASGQWATWPTPIAIGPLPRVLSVQPVAGPSAGGFDMTVTGQHLPAAADFRLVISGFVVPPSAVLEASSTQIRFRAPPYSVGAFVIRGHDARTGLSGDDVGVAFTFQPTPLIDSVAPNLVSVLGGEVVEIRGTEFAAGDRVLLETGTPGVFETLAGPTLIGETTHRFTAPVRAAGRYVLHVESALGHRRPVGADVRAFTFEDATGAAGLGDVFADDLEAISTATADLDGDGHDELVLSRAGGASAAAVSLTRVLRNDDGVFEDVTDEVLPEPPSGDDWRADRVRVEDVDGDGRPEISLLTESATVPPSGRSGLRILRNVVDGTVAGGRRFVDATASWMPPARTKRPTGSAGPVVADDWRGRDLWIGDLDADDVDDVAELVVMGGSTFSEPYVFTGSYATTGSGYTYLYGMYWPATRVFKWDAEARSGLGAFRFDYDRLPRRQGVSVFLGGAPPGVYTGTCNNATPCEHSFTPFAGTSLAVGDLDGDGRNDIAVVSPEVIQRRSDAVSELRTTSSLQIALGFADPTQASGMTDITDTLRELGIRASRVAIGTPDSAAAGVLVVTDSAAVGAPSGVLRVVRMNPELDVDPPAFEDVTAAVVPTPTAADEGQAAALEFRDINGDGRADLVLLAGESPAPGSAALRIWRAVSSTTGTGWRLVRAYESLLDDLVGGDEQLDGLALAIGDIDDGGLPTFVLTREADGPATPETRAIRATTGE